MTELEVSSLVIEDFIDLGKLNGTEKMIYLYQLGVLDFLLKKQPFRSTANILASVLCSVLELQQSTIQPVLSAIVSENLESNKHPLYTESTVKKVNQQLINIGFNPNETN